MKNPCPLPPAFLLRRAAKEKKRRMKELFRKKSLRHLERMLPIGLLRLEEKLAMSLTMTAHMRKRGIRTVEALAYCLYIGDDYVEALHWLRFPSAFRTSVPERRGDEYLLALCEISWDPQSKRYVANSDTA